MRDLGIHVNYNLHLLTVDDIERKVDEIKTNFGAKYDAVGKVNPDAVTFENTIQPLINIQRDMSNEETMVDLPQHVVTDKTLREASVKGCKDINLFQVEMSMRKDVFDNICAFKDRIGLDGLSLEEARFVEKAIVAGKRNGLHLDEEKQQKVKDVKKKISELGTQFSSNLNEDTTCLYLTVDELDGVPEDLVKSFERDADGKCKVTMKYPHFFPVSRKCRVPSTRRRMETAYQSRCYKENTVILEQLVSLRQEQADLLGYKNHASYIHEVRMAKKPENVAKFLSDLAVKLQPLWKEERKEMLILKEDECEELGIEFDNRLNFWDVRYYSTMIEEKKFSVDQEKLKQYFPLPTVKDGLLKIYQNLLGLTFTEVKDAEKWHEDVSLFSVADDKTGEILGYFFLDLHPRDGKYGHACIMTIQTGCLRSDKSRQPTVVAMLANFSKPTESVPALLDHPEVETFFHEFGHVMHAICTRVDTCRFSMSGVERDFIEAPSQMLENWVWEKESLQMMSGHYADKSDIPADIVDKLIASKKANAGAFNLRQIILATFDQRIHTRAQADTEKIFADTYDEILGVSAIPGTSMPATFGHMVGYDAQYYGYMWSDVFSSDMFETRFKAEGLLNKEVGMDYRNCILRPGSTKDAMDMLKDFLGREPNEEAFLRSKGLTNK